MAWRRGFFLYLATWVRESESCNIDTIRYNLIKLERNAGLNDIITPC